jgi:hypothetical protein
LTNFTLLLSQKMVSKTLRNALPFDIKHAVLKYLVGPEHQTFHTYCDQHKSTFGGPGSDFRVRAQKWAQDTRQRLQHKDPVKFKQLLKQHGLDSSGNTLHSETDSDEDSDETDSDETDNTSINSSIFASPPTKHSKMATRRSSHLKFREDDYDDEIEPPRKPASRPSFSAKELMRTGKFSYHFICMRTVMPR